MKTYGIAIFGFMAWMLAVSGTGWAETVQAYVTNVNRENNTVTILPTSPQPGMPGTMQVQLNENALQQSQMGSINDLAIGDELTLDVSQPASGQNWQVNRVINVQAGYRLDETGQARAPGDAPLNTNPAVTSPGIESPQGRAGAGAVAPGLETPRGQSVSAAGETRGTLQQDNPGFAQNRPGATAGSVATSTQGGVTSLETESSMSDAVRTS